MYKFSKCPHCGKYIDAFKLTGWNDLTEQIGNPVGFCLRCRNAYNTGRKYWKDMGSVDRCIAYCRVGFGALMGGVVAGANIIAALFYLKKWLEIVRLTDNNRGEYLIGFLFAGTVYSAWFHISELRELQSLPKAVKTLENFTKREKVEKPIETLPEIDLDDGKPIEALPEIDLDDEDQFEGRMGISISQGGDAGKIDFAMAAFGVWEKIEKMEEGDSKRLMIRAFEEYVERELRKLNDEQG